MIRSLEGLRGIAALLVALYHLGIGAQHVSLIRNGYLFVDLFFVLSGFIMFAAYGKRLGSVDELRVFLVRRFGRLFPLLIFSTVVFVLAANTIVLLKRELYERGYASVLNNPEALEWLMPSATEVLATVTLTHSLGIFDRLILNTPSWSISVEFYAYLLFAALCLGSVTRVRLLMFALVSVVGAGVTIWASVSVHDCLTQRGCMSVTYDFGFARAVFSFFMGALACQYRNHLRINPAILQTASLVMLALIMAYVDAIPWVAFILPVVFTLLIVSVAADEGPLAVMLRPRPLQLLGLWSYSIYLMHMPLLLFFSNLAGRVEGPFSSTVVMLVFVIVLLAVSAWTYRYVEDPMRAWFNRLATGAKLAVGRSSP